LTFDGLIDGGLELWDRDGREDGTEKVGITVAICLGGCGNVADVCPEVCAGDDKAHMSGIVGIKEDGDGETFWRSPEGSSSVCHCVLGEGMSELEDAIGKVGLKLETSPTNAIFKGSRKILDTLLDCIHLLREFIGICTGILELLKVVWIRIVLVDLIGRGLKVADKL